MKPYLSIVIPAYDEAKRLPKTLVAIDAYLSKVKYTYEILVVNDGSKDNTVDIVQKMIPTIKNLKLLDNKENKGKGGVVREGMLLTTGEIRLFMDADNSTSIDQFEKMRPLFKKDFDVVIGSRGLKESVLQPSQPWYRKIPGKMGNLIIQTLLLSGIKDTQCGFKAFKAEVVEAVFPQMKIPGWGFDIEALALAKRMGFRISEIPVVWANDLDSRVGASAYLKVLKETLTIWYRLLIGNYHINPHA